MTTPERETERQEAVRLANRILERPWADPDDDLAVLSRQFLRALEREEIAQRSASSALLAAKAEEREACAVELEEWAEATNVIRDKFKAAEQKFTYLTSASAVRARGAPAVATGKEVVLHTGFFAGHKTGATDLGGGDQPAASRLGLGLGNTGDGAPGAPAAVKEEQGS